ncbi:CDP-diacylglycerol--serine O-phosphatidyltransferase [soil metagenome]
MVGPGRRSRLQRGVVILPSAFTLGNLFLGIWAIVSAARGEFEQAGWLIVLAAIADLFDGRVARFTRTGTEFGEQLDSLVDAISFGVAPALIIYFLFLWEGGWNWLVSFIYIVAALIRLARFNVEQAGTAKAAFHGLPSPTAGVTLATFYAFTQTGVFRLLFPTADVPQVAVWMVLGVSVLMISHVLYPVVPRFSLRTWSGRFSVALIIGAIMAAFTEPALFFFPMAMLYIAVGLTRSVVGGFVERLPDRDPLIDEDDDEEQREIEYGDFVPRSAGSRTTRPHLDDGR